MTLSTTVAPWDLPSQLTNAPVAICEEAPSTPLRLPSHPLSESEEDSAVSREVSFADLSACAESEGVRDWQGTRSPTVSAAPTPLLFDPCLMKEDEEAFLTEDEDIAELVAMTEEFGFTFEEISEKEDIFVRADSPGTEHKTDEISKAVSLQSNAAQIVSHEPEVSAVDKENVPPPKWSPARIARDLQLANPFYTHATSVTRFGGKASDTTLVRVPFADITNMVISEMEKKRDITKKSNICTRNKLSGSTVNAKKNKCRPALRMLR